MRILMISDVYFPRVNGVSTSIQSFRHHLQKLGHHVTLVAPAYPAAYNDDEHTIRIPSRAVPLDPEDRMLKMGELLKHTDELAKQEFDLIHIQTPFVAHYAGVKLARQLGLPVVVTYHTFFEEYLYNYIPFLPKSLLRFVARKFSASQCNEVDAVIVPSSPIEKRLKAYGVTSPMRRLPTGIDPNEFQQGDGDHFRDQFAIDRQRPTMAYIGRVAHEKNIEFLLEVANHVRHQIPNLLFLIAGEGPALDRLKKRSQQLELTENILFVGYLSRERQLQDCYCAGNLFVFASRTETQGLVLLEAMSLGVPVVSTAVLGTKDILKGECGALVAEEDVDDFSGKVAKVLSNQQLQQQLSAQARKYSRLWQADHCARAMAEFYRELVIERPITEAATQEG